MDKTLEILDTLTKQVSSAEVYSVASESVKVGFRAGKLVASEVQEISGVSVRAIDDGKLGFYSTTDLSDLKHLIESTVSSVKFGGEANFDFATPQNTNSKIVETFNDQTAKMDIQELVELGQRLVAKITGYAQDVICNCNLTRTVMDTHLANSKNLNQQSKNSSLNLNFQIQRVRGDDVFVAWENHNAVGLEAEFEKLADKVIQKLQRAENATVLNKLMAKDGKLPVVFAPGCMGLFVLPLEAGLNGKNAFLGVSPLTKQIGETIFDSRFSILDDPFLPNRVNSATYDQEGIATRVSKFIESGVLQDFYYDLKSAGDANTKSTGHGKRLPDNTRLGQPTASTFNLVIEPGDSKFNDMISDIEEGLLVEGVLGMGQSNVLAGSFSNSVGLAYKIERGEITGRVKDVSVAGNVYEMLKNQLTAISSEREIVHGSLLTPYLRFDGVSVMAKS